MNERIHSVVAVYNPLDAERSGGTEKSTRNLIDFRRDGRAEWSVITPFPAPVDIKGIELPAVVSVPDSPYRIPTQEALTDTIAQLRDQDPQIIVLTSPNEYMRAIYDALPTNLQERTALLWRIKANFNTRQVMEEATDYDISYNRKLIELRREMALKVPLNLAISTSVENSLMGIGVPSEKISVIPTQVGGEYSADLRFAKDRNIRDEYLKPKEFGVLGVGRRRPGKGWDDLIKTWGHLRRGIDGLAKESDFDEIKISVAGRGTPGDPYDEQLRMLEQEIGAETEHFSGSERVVLEWLDDQLPEELQKLYCAYDVGAMFMNENEAVGRVTVEALSSGMPILGNAKCESTVNFVEGAPDDEPVGKIINSPEEAAHEVFSLMRDKRVLERMQVSAAKYGAETFTLEAAEKAWWNAVEPLLSGTK
jgi:glycosyltransferase involved in cell wall biosynthesis